MDIGAAALRIGTLRVLVSGVERIDNAVHERASTVDKNAQRTLASLGEALMRPSAAMLDLTGTACMRSRSRRRRREKPADRLLVVLR